MVATAVGWCEAPSETSGEQPDEWARSAQAARPKPLLH